MRNNSKINPTSLTERVEIYTPENLACMSTTSNLTSIFQLVRLFNLTEF